ncbi:sensor histidine kinase [Clostridium sartagoforme]|uniref:sensor histidine kinase n=1 Tax=Clostridium sartagoforme TaxID=84031 RepID=UPI0031E2778C
MELLNIRTTDLCIIIKLILCIFIGWTSIEIDKLNLIVVSFILIYIITSFSREFLCKKNRYFSEILTIVEIILAFLFSLKYMEIGVLMLSISIAEYLINEKKKIHAGVILSIIPILLILKYENLKEVIIILCIMLISIVNNEVKLSKIENTEKIQEKQRKLIYNLQKKLSEERDTQEQILHTARLEERNKISTRLHDKIGHTISGTLLQLEAIKILLEDDKEKGYSMLNSCTQNLRSGMEEIRMTLRNIKPAEEELGINRIRRVLDEKIKGTKIKGKVSYTGDLDKINSKTWIIFIQAVTELTTNSIKYSKGDLIKINIEIMNRFIKLEVKDNGIGCKKIKMGIGLRNIEEKVNTVEGKFILNGEKGFGIIILIPYTL